jgi:hypothetical protein
MRADREEDDRVIAVGRNVREMSLGSHALMFDAVLGESMETACPQAVGGKRRVVPPARGRAGSNACRAKCALASIPDRLSPRGANGEKTIFRRQTKSGRLIRSLNARENNADSGGGELSEAPESCGVHFNRRTQSTFPAPMALRARQPTLSSAAFAKEHLFFDMSYSHSVDTSICAKSRSAMMPSGTYETALC